MMPCPEPEPAAGRRSRDGTATAPASRAAPGARGRGVARRAAPVAALVTAAVLAAARPSGAQPGSASHVPPIDDREYPVWVGQFTVLSGNVLVGGLAAGITQRLRGGSFQDGFARGALGGLTVYAGKRIAVERFGGAGLLGRQVGAVGASIVRNASDGRPSLERVLLPVGPVHLHVEPGAERRVRPRVDLANLLWTGWAVAEPRLAFDARASLSTGAPVFRVEELLMSTRWGHGRASGLSAAGTILLSDIADWGEERAARTAAHERVHVLQDDFMFYVASHPVELWLLDRIPGGASLGRYVDLNLGSNVHGLLAFLFGDYHDRPWEMEAEYLERR